MSVYRVVERGPEWSYPFVVERKEGWGPFGEWHHVTSFEHLDQAEAEASLRSELDSLYPREQSRWKAGKRL
jgi:hypothetical protein